MSARTPALAVLGGLLAAMALGAARTPAPRPPPVERFRVTEGRLKALGRGVQRIDVPRLRAVVDPRHEPWECTWACLAPERPREAELRFVYRGPTETQRPLRSGEARRQVGLKLRARDGCNVVYVMWRLAPTPGLVVSVKSNPVQHRSRECGNGGYDTVKPARAAEVPVLEPGEEHTLKARLEGKALGVQVDGRTAWEGTLPDEALTFDGPTGLRTDNGQFDVELRATP